ncbi:MAG: SDR family NAD(P)-dependent oxidoreductase [Euryarchaeota archaeon]|nr:SDR family NAD(P)-dependent oxidoreductase [Euryarchaeota archaeon]
MRALVTGGAGFIGSHLADALVARGDDVVILDSLAPDAHADAPDYAVRSRRFFHGDVRDPATLRAALTGGVDVVFHEAALVGLGRGDADRSRFLDVNVEGTRQVLRALAPLRPRPRVVLASSMALYGEGAYRCESCSASREGIRTKAQLESGDWDPRCPACGSPLRPQAVPESHAWRPGTAYAHSKADQEREAFVLASSLGIPLVALRYHNVYGPRMPRNTPYAGVASLLKSRILSGRPPVVHEDGRQLRDFIHVKDVVAANLLAAEAPEEAVRGQPFNVGSGKPVTILDLANVLVQEIAPDQTPELRGSYRPGDARHVFGSIEKIQQALGFQPRIGFQDGFRSFAHDPMRTAVEGLPLP